MTKKLHQFVHYFIQLGLEIDEVFFDPNVNPFAESSPAKNKRYQRFIKTLYTEELIVRLFTSSFSVDYEFVQCLESRRLVVERRCEDQQ